ncbi:MAG: hypothetical protein TREMPRED_001274 [Tremellales sp. Tagirdzhanova-0007]|nr:MAG: hypothetical protein TREMPRED_001274 [Tremellales sp. Tagirdzhanova-0007]
MGELVSAAHNGTRVSHVHVTHDDPLFVWYIAIIVVLVLLGACFSGLTLGLMGLDSVNLQVLSLSGTSAERRQAPKVLSLIKAGRHTMLVMLLLGNTLVNTSLPIFLDSIVGGGYIAVLGSTALEAAQAFFVAQSDRRRCTFTPPTEIIPQSICSHYGLAIGASFAPVVRVLILLTYPIVKPIAMLLDYVLGTHNEGLTYRKAELKTFVSLGIEDKLGDEEIELLGSVLDFSGKAVGDVMTPIEDVFKLSAETIVCPPDLGLLEAMAYFQTGRSHILLVTTEPGKDKGAVGVVTLEDVVEELIGKEIIDETDVYVDIHSRVPVVRPKNRPGLKRIVEGRIARRRVVIEAAAESMALIIDHPDNA